MRSGEELRQRRTIILVRRMVCPDVHTLHQAYIFQTIHRTEGTQIAVRIAGLVFDVTSRALVPARQKGRELQHTLHIDIGQTISLCDL